jgi:methyltransferase
MLWAYPAAFVAMGLEGVFGAGWPESIAVAGLVLMLVAKALKYWAIATLGSRWTFRVLVPPGAPRIQRGPYAVVSHPNYVAVIGELIAFGLVVGAPFLTVVSVLGFGELIRRRIRVEEQALRAG